MTKKVDKRDDDVFKGLLSFGSSEQKSVTLEQQRQSQLQNLPLSKPRQTLFSPDYITSTNQKNASLQYNTIPMTGTGRNDLIPTNTMKPINGKSQNQDAFQDLLVPFVPAKTTQSQTISSSNFAMNSKPLMNSMIATENGNVNTNLNQNLGSRVQNQFQNPIPTSNPNKNVSNWRDFDLLENKKLYNESVNNPARDIFDLDFLDSQALKKKQHQIVVNDENPLGILGLPVKQALQNDIHISERNPTEPTIQRPIEANEDSSLFEKVSELVKMGFSEDAATTALLECNLDVQKAVNALLLGNQNLEQTFVEKDLTVLSSMGFKTNESREALKATNGNVDEAVEMLLKQKREKRVLFSETPLEQPSSILDTSKLVNTASQFGFSILKNAKNVLEMSKKKVEKVLVHATSESSKPKESELEYSNSRYRDNVPSQTPLKKLLDETPFAPFGGSNEDIDIPLQRSKSPTINENKAVSNLLYFQSKNIPFQTNPSVNQPDAIAFSKPKVIATNEQLVLSDSLKVAGNELFKQGQFADAEQKYTDAISVLPENHPNLIPLYNNRAACRLKNGNNRGVLEDCTYVHETNPNDLKCLLRRATALEALEDWESARNDYRRIMGIDPNVKGVSLGLSRCNTALQPKTATSIPTPTTASKYDIIHDRKPMVASVKKAVEEAVQKLRDQNNASEKEENEKFALLDIVNSKIDLWKRNKETNLRALLSSLELVLWKECGWKAVTLSELITAQQVKIKYLKAAAKVHPDKLAQDSTTEQKLIANSVFSVLNKAWDEFKSTNNL